ncbi:hypothetical protein GGH93_006073 [Coemansia aciculifera]|nr:hypothetical protein GGH93_006073 [Coemansia aciculifera]
MADVEREIWEHMQRGNFDKAVSLSCQARKQQNKDGPPMSLLTRFALTKRQFQVECLYAGIYASTRLSESNDLGVDDYLLFFAALLADRDPGLLGIYSDLSGSRRKAVDVALAGSMAYYHLKQGKRWRSPRLWAFLPMRAQIAIEWAVHNTSQLAQAIPSDYARSVHAAWMLRRPNSGFTDVSGAGKIVEALLRAGITPDLPVLETLVTSSVRVGEVGAALPVYASRQWPQNLSHGTLVDLVDRRATMALSAPRIHYDVLGASVRANDLHTVLVVASALRSRQVFHFVISIWVSHHKDDWKGIVELTRTMLRVLTDNLLHSTHHLVISAMMDMARPGYCNATLANVVLSNALALHWVLAPRLESPSVAAIHKLLRALIDHGMSESAFQVYRDSERRSNWKSPVSSDAIFAVLAGELARREDIRSIMHLASVATRGGIFISAHFYSAVICGLTMPIKLMANSGAYQYSRKRDHGRYYQPALGPSGYGNGLRRIQIAESMFDSMRRNEIDAPVKVYHALMYAWALLGQPRQVQSYFAKLEQNSKGGSVGISEVAWGILLYSHARAHDVQGTLSVLARAREWVSGAKTHGVDGRTSYLVNISVCALLVDRDTRSALTLLDACIQRYNEYLQSDKEEADRNELPATPADPVTRSLIIRALLDNQRLAQAVDVHNSMHAQFNLAEYASELKPMLKFCLGQGDTSSALQIARRILRIGGVGALTDSQWIRLLHLCIEEGRDADITGLLSDLAPLSSEHGDFGTVVMPVLRNKYPEAVDWISRVLRKSSIDDGAGAMVSLADVDSVSVVEPPVHAQCLSLYRSLMRAVREFPLAEMRGKFKHNARFCFELYRDLEPDNPKIQQLISDGRQQLQWLSTWQDDAETCQKLVHKPRTQ